MQSCNTHSEWQIQRVKRQADDKRRVKGRCPYVEAATLFWSDNNRLRASQHVISIHDR